MMRLSETPADLECPQIPRGFPDESSILFQVMFMKRELLLWGLLAATMSCGAASAAPPQPTITYSELIRQEGPVAYWSFNTRGLRSDIGRFEIREEGTVPLQAGAAAPEYPLFDGSNRAIHAKPGLGYLRISDPGRDSALDFNRGDSLTVEAWVAPERVKGFVYLIGKGRTYRTGFDRDNQNWAVRLKEVGGAAALTFLFRSAGDDSAYHRWTSSQILGVGDGWHHVALSYTFGQAESLRAYIDGERTKGSWDLGGATKRPPVVDDDEVWIGSSMGGQAASTFEGGLDEIAVYRHVLDADRIQAHFAYQPPPPVTVESPSGQVLVQIWEGLPDKASWRFRTPQLRESFTTRTFALPELPHRYSERGVRIDRPVPFLVRIQADVHLPEGPHRLLVRSRDSARLFVDDQLVAETPFYAITATANGPIWELDRGHGPNIRPLQRGDRQHVIDVIGQGRLHRIRFETLVGLTKRRPEMGEVSVSRAAPEGDFTVIGFSSPVPLTNEGWEAFLQQNRSELVLRNQERRRDASRQEAEYWEQRHQLAREFVGRLEIDELSIDHFIDTRLSQAEMDVNPPLDDLEFLRRLTLDVIGVVPSRAQISQYLADPPDQRRRLMVDRLLEHPGWADHWVAYWQDVLAENPNIVNPALNNTGPFRWWIYESFLDNKPIDRFVTELVLMEGSPYYGGPAGFRLATENDVPMAAKAHILGQAFLGIQMQCARCHDAPNHDVAQRDLFSLAAMLERAPLKVPETSTVNLSPEELQKVAVEVTLKPGESVAPDWTLADVMSAPVPAHVLRDTKDSRERLAALMTLPQNQRLAKVVVNRIWARYLGRGIVDPVHDWDRARPSHPELLDWLARELIVGGYDLKHVARLILNSEVYGRRPVQEKMDKPADLFAGPLQRKLTAEQLVDSFFVISGKSLNAGPMANDIDGARPSTVSLHLGSPRKAWMFASTSNERDRPSLALPFAEPFITFLEQFGWRGARQGPVNERPDELTALQPAEFANGLLARRVTRLSDDHALAAVAGRKDLTCQELVRELYLRILTREPTERERELIVRVLDEGFTGRRRPDSPLVTLPLDRRGMVSWSVHLEELASEIKIELQELVRQGDPPTGKLEPRWRERLEDVIWSMINSPELRFSP